MHGWQRETGEGHLGEVRVVEREKWGDGIAKGAWLHS